ncbi:hypothetical protein HMPREF1536_03372, partial [Parabacteroides gordonii MS-1 = DSM 23371]
MLRNIFFSTLLLAGSFLAQAQDREYVIVVHGGAGDVAKLESDP